MMANSKITILLLLLSFLVACTQSGSSSSPVNPTELDQAIEGTGTGDGGTNQPGRALLGPVVNANVEAYNIKDLEVRVCETVTSDSTEFDTAGQIIFPPECIIEPQEFYLIVVSGGNDIDVDDDGEIDSAPTAVKGVFRTLIRGEHMQTHGWHVSAITESYYQSLQYLLLSNYSEQELLQTMDHLAPLFISEDINNDGRIDVSDILAWNPTLHGDSVTDKAELEYVLHKIHTGLINSRTLLELPAQENLIYHLNTVGKANHIQLQGEFSFVATRNALISIDRSDPENIHMADVLPTGWISDLEVYDNLAFVSLGSGLEVLDISDPHDIKRASFLEINTKLTLAVDHKTLLTGGFEDGHLSIQRIDISEPSAPVITNKINLSSASHIGEMHFYNNHVYITSAVGSRSNLVTRIDMLELSDDGSLTLINTFVFDSNSWSVASIAFHEDKVFAGIGSSIIALSASPSEGFIELKRVKAPSTDELKVSNGLLYALQDLYSKATLRTYTLDSLSKLRSIIVPGYFSSQSLNRSFTIIDNQVHLAAQRTGYLIMDISRLRNFSHFVGRNTLGPIANATVTVHAIDDLTGEPLCQFNTANTTDIEEVRQIKVPIDCVNGPDSVRISLSGGHNIDVDDDGIVDTKPTSFPGELHAIVNSTDLVETDWVLSAVSEENYQCMMTYINAIDKTSMLVDDSDAEAIYRGVFIDSPVSGLGYQTDSQSGYTDVNGEFQYKLNERISFSLGDIFLGGTEGQATITPMDLELGTDTPSYASLLNKLRLLQTLDDDGDTSNGININEQTRNDAIGLTIDFRQGIDDFALDAGVQALMLSRGASQLIDASKALSHFQAAFTALNENSNNQNTSAPANRRYTFIASLDASDEVRAILTDTFTAFSATAGIQLGTTVAGAGNGYVVGNIILGNVEQTTLFSSLVLPPQSPVINLQASEIAEALSSLSGVMATASTWVTLSELNYPINGLIINGVAIENSEDHRELLVNLIMAGFKVDMPKDPTSIDLMVESGEDIVINTAELNPGSSITTTGVSGISISQSRLNNALTTTGGILRIVKKANIRISSAQTAADNVWGLFDSGYFSRQSSENGFSANDPVTYNVKASTTVHDSLGLPHKMTYFFVKEPLDTNDLVTGGQPNTWSLYVQIDDEDVGGRDINAPTLARYILRFNSDGTLSQTEPTRIIVSNWTPKLADCGSVLSVAQGPNPDSPYIDSPPTSSNFEISLPFINLLYDEPTIDFKLSVKGKGYLQLMDANARMLYTKSGRFHIDEAGMLVNKNEQTLRGYATDSEGSLIQVPSNLHLPHSESDLAYSAIVRLDASGYFSSYETGTLGLIKIADFLHPDQLEEVGVGLWAESLESGVPSILPSIPTLTTELEIENYSGLLY